MNLALLPSALLLAVCLPAQSREITLVDKGQDWWYLDTGSFPGSGWQSKSVPQRGWRRGRAQLGYGDRDERTRVSFGSSANNKHITTYFAKSFQVANRNQFRVLKLRGIFDDGAVIYLNGVEVWRFNMPTGTIANSTLAKTTISGGNEDTYFLQQVAPTALRNGTNVLAAEIHQVSRRSSDVSFDLQVLGSDGATSLIRGPYLQLGTPNSVVVRWRTDAAEDTVVWHGLSTKRLTRTVVSTSKGFKHEARIGGLQPNTRYYYAVGTTRGRIQGGDAQHTFVTSPRRGQAKPTRIWILGDSGTRDQRAAAVRDGFKRFMGQRRPDLWLMLGDNAYEIGRDIEHQEAVFDMYPTFLRSTVLWPTIGNHELPSARSRTQSGVYYDVFTLPARGEAGGLASGTEAYYSFDYGNIHFVCLDSEDSDRSKSAAMLSWMTRDLANSSAQWLIAFWHRPPYSKGGHDSDRSSSMTAMRTNALPILEAAGVDLVLTGHSHSYERSLLVDRHYGTSTTLKSSMILDPGDGRPQGDGAYRKRPGGHDGAVYAVAGSSGRLGHGKLNHPIMVISLRTLGSMVLDIDRGRLDAKFVDTRGKVLDSFTLEKGAGRVLRRDVARLSLSKGGAQTLRLDAGKAQAGNVYIVAGSYGTSPGFRFGGVQVPLNPDAWFTATLSLANTSIFDRFIGTLDPAGRATPTFRLPATRDTSLLGMAVQHAALVFDKQLQPSFASNWERVRFAK